ncbi:MAG: site-specific DNA-methyltransferase [Candidatus Heimdallarchaeaceae archaeon]
MNKEKDLRLKTVYVDISALKPTEYNPRIHKPEAMENLKESIKRFGLVDPLIINSAPNRFNVVIGGHFRLKAAKALGYKKVPVIYANIPDLKKEKELCIRLNKNTGEFDWGLLADFDETFLSDIGFSSEDLDEVFKLEDIPEEFDLIKELKKLNIEKIEIQKGDIYKLGNHKMMCGDSTIKKDVLKLMNREKAQMCFCDPPYLLDYLHGKKKCGKVTEGFGYKRDRRYLETDILPPDFTQKWMMNVSKVQDENFSIICFENWKNIRTIWDEMEKYWKIRNMIVWHLSNRVQGFAAKYKFFNKHDIAMVATSKDKKTKLNITMEEEFLQNEYETALYATSGKPQWENYEKGKRICPTDFIEFHASDEKSSGQGIIFGTKPIEILIPYIKVLTKRNDLIIEPFGGSGSTLIAAEKMQRRCYLMEKSPVYCEVIKRRWEKLTGQKAQKINHEK